MIDDRHLAATGRPKAEGIDTAAPNAARVADYLNGGRDNFEADRRAAWAMIAAAPAIAAIVPAVLAFHQRAVRFLAIEAGIRQFLDVGTGLPGVQSRIEIAQSVDPACRVVYVDHDPMVLSHVRAFCGRRRRERSPRSTRSSPIPPRSSPAAPRRWTCGSPWPCCCHPRSRSSRAPRGWPSSSPRCCGHCPRGAISRYATWRATWIRHSRPPPTTGTGCRRCG